MDHQQQVSISVDDHEIAAADCEVEVSSSNSSEQFEFFTKNGMIKLQEGYEEGEIIKRRFLSSTKDAHVVAIHKNLYSSFLGQARLDTFRIFSEAVAKKCGGDANIRYAWYGGSRNEICEIISRGFSKCREPSTGDCYGVGIYLLPDYISIESCSSIEEDESGFRHMLLCRVILGKTEVVDAGSRQSQPSSDDFDSGVDNISAPTKYIIWGPYMNSFIFPNYVISFKAAPSVQRNIQRGPSSPYMKFSALLPVLSNFLPPARMALLSKYYNDFRGNKITRLELVRRIRQIVGDELLVDLIKLCKAKKMS